jgi:hypothetical protein
MYANSTNNTNPGTSSLNVQGNRFARCTGVPVTYNASLGGHTCGPNPPGSSAGSGADGHGYWPCGGYFGFDLSMESATATWSGNVWDDNNAPAVENPNNNC